MAAGRAIHLTIFSLIFIFNSVISKSDVVELNEENWTDMLKNQWMVEFYAPWCPACKSLQPTWQNFATWSKSVNLNVGQVDVTNSPGLSGRFMVTALPTIFHVINGEFRQYKSTRDENAFQSFVKNENWKTVEPIPSWKSPNSYSMSIVSSFFKLSQVLRGIHTHLMEEYGLPTWGSYLIFAVATILLGAMLGLLLVCVIDLIYPPRHTIIKTPNDKSGTAPCVGKGSGDDLADEDIKDDLLDDASASEEDNCSASEPEDKSAPPSPNIRKRKTRID